MSDGFVTVAQCVEGLPCGRFVWELLFCALVAWFMLGAINESSPLAFSYVATEWQATEEDAAMMSAALAFGNFVAVLIGGWVADRHGRTAVIRPALLLTVSAAMVLQTARTFFQALFVRFLLGLVSGALLSVLPPLVAELLPARNRGFYLTVWCCGWPAGALVSVLVGCLAPGLNWRAFYTILLVPAIVVYMCLRAEMLPESPRYLYLVGRRDEGYNTLLDMYEAEQMPLPWPAESIAVSCAPATSGSEGGASCSTLPCKTATASHVSVAMWLSVTMFLTSAASQSMKIWMPVLLLSNKATGAAENLGLLGTAAHVHRASATTASNLLGRLPLVGHTGAGGAVLSLIRAMPDGTLQKDPNRYIVLVLAQAYAVQTLGVILCAYGSTWIRRKQMVQWSLPAAALFTLLALGAAEGGALALCGPLLGLQLAAQSCSLNFLMAFAAEHFPTSRRALIVAIVVVSAQLGDFVMPLLGGLVVQRVSRPSAVIFFGGLYVLAWLVSHRLPLPTSRERSLHDVDEPRGPKEESSRIRKREHMTYQTI